MSWLIVIQEKDIWENTFYIYHNYALFKLAGVTMEFVMKKLFSISLKDKASYWYKLLDNSDLLEWPELMSLYYAKFYPLRETHQDRTTSTTFGLATEKASLKLGGD